MKGTNGVQMQVHPKFLETCKNIKDDRIMNKKERNGEFSFKRLSLTITKLLSTKPEIYNMIINAEIDLKNEI